MAENLEKATRLLLCPRKKKRRKNPFFVFIFFYKLIRRKSVHVRIFFDTHPLFKFSNRYKIMYAYFHVLRKFLNNLFF